MVTIVDTVIAVVVLTVARHTVCPRWEPLDPVAEIVEAWVEVVAHILVRDVILPDRRSSHLIVRSPRIIALIVLWFLYLVRNHLDRSGGLCA